MDEPGCIPQRPRLRQRLWKCTPSRPQFYAVGNIPATPIIAPKAKQIFRRHATAKERRVKEILETSLLKRWPCSLSGAKAFTFHLYVFSGRALFYVAIARNKGHKIRLILIQVFAYRWQGTMNFCFYQLSLPCLIILETVFSKKQVIFRVCTLNWVGEFEVV